MLMALSSLTWAQDDKLAFTYGEGTIDSPYEIWTYADLKLWSDNAERCKEAYFKLSEDVIVEEGFVPISTYYGIFQGYNHTISGLTDALFATLYGEITNLKVDGNIVKSCQPVGILCYFSMGAQLTNVSASGSITMSSSGCTAPVGGIAGQASYSSNTATFIQCSSSVTINNAEGYVGGICGMDNDYSTFDKCSSTVVPDICGNHPEYRNEAMGDDFSFTAGTGTENDPYIITTAADLKTWAQHYDNEAVQNAHFKLGNDIVLSANGTPVISFFSGTFDGNNHSITGLNNRLFNSFNGTVYDLTISGNIVKTMCDGPVGLFSYSISGGKFANVTVNGSITMTPGCGAPVGGFAAYAGVNSEQEPCYFNSCTSTVTISNAVAQVGGILGIDYDNKSVFENCTSTVVSALIGNAPVVVNGSGTEADPYIISAEADLMMYAEKMMQEDTNNGGYYYEKYYKLSADIVLTRSMPEIPHFGGIFDGDNYEISGLHTPLFSGDISGATFKNLKLSGAITSSSLGQYPSPPGFLCSVASHATITDVTVSGTISLDYGMPAGGVCGISYGSTFDSCSSSVSVQYPTGVNAETGGICGNDQKDYETGEFSSTFTNCTSSVITLICGNRTEQSGPQYETVDHLEGSGSDFDPYIISSVGDLMYWSENADALKESNFKVVADIDLDGIMLNPIESFYGYLDGGNHTISGLSQNLFGYLQNSILKDLSLSGRITIQTYSSSVTVHAFLAISIYESVLENVNVGGTIYCSYGKKTVGGLCAISAETTYRSCFTNIEVKLDGDDSIAGGLVGTVNQDDQFYNCKSAAKLEANVVGPFYGKMNKAYCGVICGDDNVVLDPSLDAPAPPSDYFAGGVGSTEDPYQINNVQQFNNLAQNYAQIDASRNAPYSALNYILTADLTFLSGNPAIKEFSGSFNGGNHSISGVTTLINTLTGEVSNLNVEGAYTNSNQKLTDPVGLVCNIAEGATLSNIHVSGSINSYADCSAGGVAGKSTYSKFDSCVSDVIISCQGNAGGIAGEDVMGSEFYNCSAVNSVVGFSAGGILGFTNDESKLTLGTDNTSSVVARLCGNVGSDNTTTPLHGSNLFAGGSGTMEDPWQIATREQLVALAQNMRKEDLSGSLYENSHYKLIADIDLTGCTQSEYGVFAYGTLFGTFNGNHHKITGLSRPLFAYINKFDILDAEYRISHNAVWDLTLEGEIDGTQVGDVGTEESAMFGLLALEVKNSIIRNVNVSGTIVSEKSTARVGGLIGLASQSIFLGCSADVTLSAGNVIADYYFDGSKIGGIVGEERSCDFINCSTSGYYTNATCVGGIAGCSYEGMEYNSSDDPSIPNQRWCRPALFKGCSSSATMNVTNGSTYWMGYTVGFSTGYQQGSQNPDYLFVCGFDNVNTGTQTDLPIVGNYNGPSNYFAGGTGTQADPFIITQEQHLKNLALHAEEWIYGTNRNYFDSYYRLDNNIELTSHTEQVPYFYGNFDGNGKTISGLDCALFGSTNDAYIYDLTLEGDIKSNKYDPYNDLAVGMLVESGNQSMFKNITVKGSIETTMCGAGGIAGTTMLSMFDKCVSYVTINSASDAGGICASSGTYDRYGTNGSTFRDCVSYANITTNDTFMGGLCGYDYNGSTFIRCMSHATLNVHENPEYEKGFNSEIVGGILGWTQKNADLTLRTDNKYFGELPINLCGNRHQEDRIDEYFYYGKGTADDPYQIASMDDLRNLYTVVSQNLSNAEGYSYSKACYKLTENIQMDDNWTTIPGTFYGYFGTGQWTSDRKRITNITAPLFEKMSSTYEGTLNTKYMSAEYLILSGSISENNEYVGMLCREADGNARFVKVSVSGNIASTHSAGKVGGICGYTSQQQEYDAVRFEGCSVVGNLTGVYVGGLVGYNAGKLEVDNCTTVISAAASGSGQSYLGYILGYTDNEENITLKRIYNKGEQTQLWACGNVEPEGPLFASGTGTESDPYIIATKEQFMNFVRVINEDPHNDPEFRNKHFILACDVELTAEESIPATDGNYTYSSLMWGTFSGTFNGEYNGETHTISGLTIPLFSGLDNDVVNSSLVYGEVKNLNLQANIVTDETWGTGILCEQACNKVTNVHVSGSITLKEDMNWPEQSRVGAIAGYSNSAIFTNCSSTGTYQGNIVGGICGYTSSSPEFYGCTSDATLKKYSEAEDADKCYLGGILGYYDQQYGTHLKLGKDNKCKSDYWRIGNVEEFNGLFDGGDGTAENPYQISTKEQMVKLAQMIDGKELDEDNQEYGTKSYILTADIELDETFHPIGTQGPAWQYVDNVWYNYQHPNLVPYINLYDDGYESGSYGQLSEGSSIMGFRGTFDGDGHTISGLKTALFDSFSEGAVVKNLTLEANIVNDPELNDRPGYSNSDLQFLGILANVASDGFTIDGVTVNGSISGGIVVDEWGRKTTSVVGGLIGLMTKSDFHSQYGLDYTEAKTYNGHMADINCTIKNTTVNAQVAGPYAGMVIGESINSNVTQKRLKQNAEYLLHDDDDPEAEPIVAYMGVTIGKDASATTTRTIDNSFLEGHEVVISDVELQPVSYDNLLVGRATPDFFEGNGTVEDPIKIQSTDDYYRIVKMYSGRLDGAYKYFVGLKEDGTVYESEYKSLNYVITNDLDFQGMLYDVNIDLTYKTFFVANAFNLDENGSLKAKDITIKNLTISNRTDNAGLVGYNQGTISLENVTFDNISLGGLGAGSTDRYAGNGGNWSLGVVAATNAPEGKIKLDNVNITNLHLYDKCYDDDIAGQHWIYPYAGGYVGDCEGDLLVNTDEGAKSSISGTFHFVDGHLSNRNIWYKWGGVLGDVSYNNYYYDDNNEYHEIDRHVVLNNIVTDINMPDNAGIKAIAGDVASATVVMNNCYDMSDNGTGNLTEIPYGTNVAYRDIYQDGYIVNPQTASAKGNKAAARPGTLLAGSDYTFLTKSDDFNKLQWDDDNAVAEQKLFASTGSGNGSSFEPYLICNKEDFMVFLKAVRQNYFNVDGVNCTKNIHVKLMHDLNFADEDRLTDIDGEIIDGKTSDFVSYTDGESFNGYIDGNGMTVSGLTGPLFAALKGAKVKNIGIVDSKIDGCALVANADGCTFENCFVSGNTNGLASTGNNTFKDCYAYNTKTKVYTPLGTIDEDNFYAADDTKNISGHPILKANSYKLRGSDNVDYYSDATLVIPTDNKMYYYQSPTRLHRLEGINFSTYKNQVINSNSGRATYVHDKVSAIDYFYVLKHYYTDFEDSYDPMYNAIEATWQKAKPHGVNPMMDNVCLLHNVWRDGEYLTKYADQQKGYTSIDEFDHARYIYSLYLTDKKDLGFDPNKVLTRIRNIHYQRTGTNGGLNTVYLPFPFNATDVKKADGTAISGVKAFMLADRIKISNKTGHDEYYYDRNAEVWDYYSDFHEGVDYDRLFFVQLTNAQMDEVTAGLPMLLNVKEKDWYIDIKDLGDKYRAGDGNYGEDHLGTEAGWDDTWADNKYALFSTCAMKDGDAFNMRYHADIIGEDQMGYSFRTVDNMGQDFACSGHAAHLGSFVTVPKGQLLSKESSGEYTFFKLNSSGNAFAHVTSNSSVTPFRTYVSIHKSSDPDAKAKTSFGMGSANFGIVEKDDIATDLDEMPGITLLTVEQQKIYSLDGIQVGTLDNVSKLAPGVYIMNGRKFVKK